MTNVKGLEFKLFADHRGQFIAGDTFLLGSVPVG